MTKIYTDKNSVCSMLIVYSFCVQNEMKRRKRKYDAILFLLLFFVMSMWRYIIDCVLGLQLRNITHLNWSTFVCYYFVKPELNDKSWKSYSVGAHLKSLLFLLMPKHFQLTLHVYTSNMYWSKTNTLVYRHQRHRCILMIK